MLTGGGTGGHLFPAIATAEALCERLPGSEVVFVGTHRKIDKTSLQKYGFKVKSIHSHGIKGKSFRQLFQALVVMPISLCEAILHIITFRPHLVIGVGGYVTGPVIAAARLLGKATVIHEQNSIPGLANRKLGKLAAKICLSIPGSEDYFPARKTVLTGNPVRKEILKLAAAGGEGEKTRSGVTVMILGGSQGARGVNRLVVEAFTEFPEHITRDVRIIHQTGAADADMVHERYEAAGLEAHVAPFFHDMEAMYRQADLIISRAGATTLAELAILGMPAILIPYPYAADNHQEKNAMYYVRGGGALMFIEKELSGRMLALAVQELLAAKEKLQVMGKEMKRLAFPEAAEKIVDVCLQRIPDCIAVEKKLI